MANIALNKPSGGQLILSPEDGTSTETVTIPSVGVMEAGSVKVHRVINTIRTVWSTSGTYQIPSLEITLTPKSVDSVFILSGRVFGESTTLGDHEVAYFFTRNGTSINVGSTGGSATPKVMAISTQGYQAGDNSSTPSTTSFTTYDAPATTSPVTYRIAQWTGSSHTFVMNDAHITTDSVGYEEGSSELVILEVTNG